jgi:hypothetical protein
VAKCQLTRSGNVGDVKAIGRQRQLAIIRGVGDGLLERWNDRKPLDRGRSFWPVKRAPGNSSHGDNQQCNSSGYRRTTG